MTEKQLTTMRLNGRKSGQAKVAAGFFSSANQSRRRINQLAAEESQAQEMRARGFEVFSPTVVCDRIAVKDGQVFFVEFKRRGQKLRRAQQTIADLVQF
ncbi:MAG: hypothetical protein Q7S58_17745 [Candidatus Binatus sp.]|uniref:hypothetical protein n=1 Tax=Candidatus Binatus sp. TaxID=2811406 RepID=UPI002719AC8D|nr:hypothetical protein [Candidatus Binatus sp.]MDO8434247.1 hypothetical protein [Candidatus Binatus sp.]